MVEYRTPIFDSDGMGTMTDLGYAALAPSGSGIYQGSFDQIAESFSLQSLSLLITTLINTSLTPAMTQVPQAAVALIQLVVLGIRRVMALLVILHTSSKLYSFFVISP